MNTAPESEIVVCFAVGQPAKAETEANDVAEEVKTGDKERTVEVGLTEEDGEPLERRTD